MTPNRDVYQRSVCINPSLNRGPMLTSEKSLQSAAQDKLAAQAAFRDEAVYYVPRNSFKAANTKVPLHEFEKERLQACASGTSSSVIPLDLSHRMGLSFPASLPNVLARYIKLAPGDPVGLTANATAVIHYVISGNGFSECEGDRIDWAAGDLFMFGGNRQVTHCTTDTPALLFTATDEPMLQYASVTPVNGEGRVKTAHFPAAEIERHLALAYAREPDADDSGKAVIFTTQQMEKMNTTSPFITVNINTLPAGGDQRPHRHNAAALTLCVEGEKVYSEVDGMRVDWRPYGVLVTPPGALHAHYSRGPKPMRSIVVQDSGVFYHARISGFSFDN